MKRHAHDILFFILNLVADFLAIIISGLMAVWIRFNTRLIPIRYKPFPNSESLYFVASVVAAVVIILRFHASSLYKRPFLGSFLNRIPVILKSLVTSTGLLIILAFALQNEIIWENYKFEFSRAVILLFMIISAIVVVFEKYLLFKLEEVIVKRSKPLMRIAIVGINEVALRLEDTIKKEPLLRAMIVGFIKTSSSMEKQLGDIPDDLVLGDLVSLEEIIQSKGINHVIVTDLDIGRDKLMEIFLLCERNLVRFNIVPDIFRIIMSQMDIQTIDGIPLLSVGKWPLDYAWNRFIKRVVDIVGSLIGIVLSIPIILVAAIAIKRSSPGPVFYSQIRCGYMGKRFKIYKLRTMYVDAEKDTGPVFATKDDPRCTQVGRLLRKYNLDELPQFWNVLKGDMSLVGPRPERPEFVEKFKEEIAHYMWRHIYKPGMTGWAQVNGLRGDTSIVERLKYDLYYLENWSVVFDIKILLRTFFSIQ